MRAVLHLMRTRDYLAVRDQPIVVACPPGGFIHCTTDSEVMTHVANVFYRDDPADYVVLVIDPSALTSELRLEPPEPPRPVGSPLAGHLFPHVYGPINREAVAAARPARRAPDGTFVET